MLLQLTVFQSEERGKGPYKTKHSVTLSQLRDNPLTTACFTYANVTTPNYRQLATCINQQA